MTLNRQGTMLSPLMWRLLCRAGLYPMKAFQLQVKLSGTARAACHVAYLFKQPSEHCHICTLEPYRPGVSAGLATAMQPNAALQRTASPARPGHSQPAVGLANKPPWADSSEACQQFSRASAAQLNADATGSHHLHTPYAGPGEFCMCNCS